MANPATPPGKPFRGAAPDNPQGKRALFDANPYRPHAGKAKPNKEEKKITVPFYPNKPLGTMGSGGNNFSTFTKMTYSSEKAKARVAPKKKDGYAPGPHHCLSPAAVRFARGYWRLAVLLARPRCLAAVAYGEQRALSRGQRSFLPSWKKEHAPPELDQLGWGRGRGHTALHAGANRD